MKTLLKLLNPLTVPKNTITLLKASDPTGVVFLLGYVAIAWGVGLLNPLTNTFTITSFAFLSGIAPENFWGILALGWGLLQTTLSANGDLNIRGWLGLSNTFWWTFIALGMALSNSGTVASYIYLVFAIAGIWAYVNVVYKRLHS